MKLRKECAIEYDESTSAALVADLLLYGPKNMKIFFQWPKDFLRAVVLFNEVKIWTRLRSRQDTNLLRRDH